MELKGWVARDNSGTLYFYTAKPRRSERCKFFMKTSGDTLELPECMFDKLSYEDEPIEVEITINPI